MGEIIGKSELDQLHFKHCGKSGKPFYFHSECHIEVPTWVSYFGGLLRIECSKCGKLIVVIRVEGEKNV